MTYAPAEMFEKRVGGTSSKPLWLVVCGWWLVGWLVSWLPILMRHRIKNGIQFNLRVVIQIHLEEMLVQRIESTFDSTLRFKW
jgi:hypothetical protein